MGTHIKNNIFAIIKILLMSFMLFFSLLYGVWGGMGILVLLVFIGFIVLEIIQKYALKKDPEKLTGFERFFSFAIAPFSLILLLATGRFVAGPSLLMYVLWFFQYFLVFDIFLPLSKVEVKASKTISILKLVSKITLRIGIGAGFLITTATLVKFDTENIESMQKSIDTAQNIRLAFGWLAYVFFFISTVIMSIIVILYIVENLPLIKSKLGIAAKAPKADVTQDATTPQEPQETVATENKVEEATEVEAEEVEVEEKNDTPVEVKEQKEAKVETEEVPKEEPVKKTKKAKKDSPVTE